jgi:hypothetical protein
MTITLNKIKRLERKAEAMPCLGNSLELWSNEELEEALGVNKGFYESLSTEELRNRMEEINKQIKKYAKNRTTD